MATIGAFNATKMRLRLNNSTTIFANEKEASITIEGDKIDITTKDSEGWQENLSGLKRWSGSGTGILAFAPGNNKENVDGLIAEFLTGDRATTVVFTTGTSGDKEIAGAVIIDRLEIKAAMESAVEVSFAFTGTGKPTYLTIPA